MRAAWSFCGVATEAYSVPEVIAAPYKLLSPETAAHFHCMDAPANQLIQQLVIKAAHKVGFDPCLLRAGHPVEHKIQPAAVQRCMILKCNQGRWNSMGSLECWVQN